MKQVTLIMLLLNAWLLQAQTRIIAHRGFSGIAPENTMTAFLKAIEAKADYIELDVHKTMDDSLVIIHDNTVDRTSSNAMKGEVEKMTFNQVKKVNVGYSQKFGDKFKNEKIPTLRQVLLVTKGKIKICIELKSEGIENKVLKLVNELKVNKAVIIFSFNNSTLLHVRQMNKRIPDLLLIDAANSSTINYARTNAINAIGVGSKTVINREFLSLAHRNGVEVWKWTVNDESEMKQLKKIGINGIITNFPDKAIAIFR